MPTNRIKVERDRDKGEFKCEVWDKNGQKHDVTDVIVELCGNTNVASVMTLKAPTDSLQTKLTFTPQYQELVFDVSELVIQQILEMK